MGFNQSSSDEVLEPEISEQGNNWNKNGLDGFSYRVEGTSYQYLRDKGLESMVAFSDEDVIELLNEEYGLEYGDMGIDNVEYGNGWALLEFE